MTGKYREAVFVVVYSLENEIPEYLILNRKLHWKGWEFPKGGIEPGEKIEVAVRREVKEETGLNILGPLQSFNYSGKYEYTKELVNRPGIKGQTFTLYAAQVKKGKILLDEQEHEKYEWLKFEEAIKRLSWENQKKCLTIVHFWNQNKKLRKMISSDGTLFLAGKDSKTNEELIKQIQKDEEVFHTSAAGSPFVNIKGKASESDIKQAALFCAKYSRDWKKNKKDIVVHWFKAQDVYKDKTMKDGTFGVKKLKTILVKKQDIEKFEK